MKYLFSILILAFVAVNTAYAVKATPNPVRLTQPDGSELIVHLKGDEFNKLTTTPDGFIIQRNDSGYFCYVNTDNAGRKYLTKQRVSNIVTRSEIEKRFLKTIRKNTQTVSNNNTGFKRVSTINSSTSENAFPLTGSPRSLVILVNFTDKSFTTSNAKSAFTNLLNQTGYSSNGGTGSARDYFIESSFGKFSPQFDVIGPVSLPQPINYYGRNDASQNDINPQQMVIDACTAADAAGVDFTQYDLDNNGIVDNVFVYYAGYNEAEGGAAETVWPHRWSLNDLSTKFDGKSVYDYACTSELKNNSGNNMCGIGTFCHEFGHVLGLVDCYHTSDDSKPTLQNWSIMDAGAYLNEGRTPPSYSSYERFYLSWLTPSELKAPENVVIKPLITDNKAFLVCKNNHNLSGSNPNPAEFFLFENRQKSGFDSYLPSYGLLIWHIDYNYSAWNNNSPNNYNGTLQSADSHMRIYLQPIGNSSLTPGTAYTSGSFTPTLWNEENLQKPVTNIYIENKNVYFKFLGGYFSLTTPVAINATDVTSTHFIANWQEVTDAKSYYLTVYNKTTGETLMTEGFDNGLTAPENWTITASGLTSSDNFSGSKVPALMFKTKDEVIQTEKYLASASKLSFFVRSMGSANGKVKVEAFDNHNWITIDELVVNLTTAGIKTYDLNPESGYIQFRLTYTEVNNNVVIDDVSVTLSELISFNCKNSLTTATSDTLKNLISERKHYYFVKASDRTLNPDGTLMYENFTANSDTIEVTTLAAAESNYLRIERDTENGNVYVFTENLNNPIVLYNTLGQYMASIMPTDLRTDITPYLRKHNLYLILSGNKSNKLAY